MTKQLLSHWRSRCGFTLIETMTAMTVFTMLAFGGLSLVVAAVNTYSRDFGRAVVETDTAQAIRRIDEGLREAYSVQVDADGMGLTFYYPQTYVDATGKHYTAPLVSDGIARRLYKSGNRLIWSLNSRPLLTNMQTSGGARIFTLQPSGHALLVSLSASTSTGRETFASTKTGVIQLRNVQ
ncbi:MAG: prepilin-type N-terminal cleavage/methylation domain-containing protein [Armatimonadetes bacterium]|nr:prepilin-type N-terminal cleavage/methylation domain-containing protein [Armatimonadota bacterium]